MLSYILWTGHFNRNKCAPAHSYYSPIRQSCGSSTRHESSRYTDARASDNVHVKHDLRDSDHVMVVVPDRLV